MTRSHTHRDSELSYEVSVKTAIKPFILVLHLKRRICTFNTIYPSFPGKTWVCPAETNQADPFFFYNSSLLCSSWSHEEGQRGVPHHSSILFLPESRDSPHSDLLPLPYPLSHSLPFPFSSKSLAHWHEAPWASIDFGDVPPSDFASALVETETEAVRGSVKQAAVWRQC